jgi:hypothetical protein
MEVWTVVGKKEYFSLDADFALPQGGNISITNVWGRGVGSKKIVGLSGSTSVGNSKKKKKIIRLTQHRIIYTSGKQLQYWAREPVLTSQSRLHDFLLLIPVHCWNP